MTSIHRITLGALLGLSLIGAGCTSYYNEAGAHLLEDPNPGVSPAYKTDYAVGERVKATGSAKVWFWFFTSGDAKYTTLPNEGIWGWLSPTRSAINRAKSAATYSALNTTQADCLLSASYRYAVTDYFFVSTITCEVRGFPATATKVTPVENRKPIVLEQGQTIHYLEPHERLLGNPTERSSRSWGLLSFFL